MQTHAWQYSFWTLLFEFHDKRHVMEFYLARKELKQSNGALETSPRNKLVFCAPFGPSSFRGDWLKFTLFLSLMS